MNLQEVEQLDEFVLVQFAQRRSPLEAGPQKFTQVLNLPLKLLNFLLNE